MVGLIPCMDGRTTHQCFSLSLPLSLKSVSKNFKKGIQTTQYVITEKESPSFAVPEPSSQRASERGLVCVFPYLFLLMQLGLFKNRIPRPIVFYTFSISLNMSWRPVPTETNNSSFFTQQLVVRFPGRSVKCI